MTDMQTDRQPVQGGAPPREASLVLDAKIRELFPGEAINKRLTKTGLLASRALPSFVSDWLIQRFANGDQIDAPALQNFLDTYLPDKSRAEQIKHQLMYDRVRIKLLADFRVTPDLKTGEERLEIPILDVSGKEGMVDPDVLNACPDLLNGGSWGVGDLLYNPPERRDDGHIVLKSFTPFRPYQISLDYYRRARDKFETPMEWMDFLVRCMEYDPEGFASSRQKQAMITRLLPFVEPRVNLIELAPKGTGKSYVFGRLSRHGWLISGGSISRAQLFYDIQKRRRGIITRYDYVAFDEIQTIRFSNPEEIIGALKGYLESGTFSVAGYHGTADCGLIILGNIALTEGNRPVNQVYVEDLPSFMQESAFIDRFHGFLEGWDLPRITVGSITAGYALNSEFFSEVLHELRGDTIPASIVDKLVAVPPSADKRDTTAVKRLATGFLKLMFPNVRSIDDLDPADFETYCFNPAFRMREQIRLQLHLMDEEYAEEMPPLVVKR